MDAVTPFIAAIAPIASSLMGSMNQPDNQAPPAPPAAAPAPVAPSVAKAEDTSGSAPVLDTEAARVRALKRRQASSDNQLIGLSESDSSTISKSLLGE